MILQYINQYFITHIKFDTILLLFCLMAVAEGVRRLGYIDAIANKAALASKTLFNLMLPIVLSCFFVSMLVTNDVALIIFVPFSIQLLGQIQRQDKLIKLVVLETIAANLGGMLTPFGNPQNVYLYRNYEMNPQEFIGATLPFGILSLLLLIGILFLDKNKGDKVQYEDNKQEKENFQVWKLVIYAILFVGSVLSVVGLLPCLHVWLVVVGTIVCMAGMEFFQEKSRDKANLDFGKTQLAVLSHINYGLLVKFVILFVVVGNIAALPKINEFFMGVVRGNEFATGILLSQVVSNVPAAVMLSKFTADGISLLQGVNVGGLGTLIASMASLISLEYIGREKTISKKQYILTFTIYNLIFLVILVGLYLGMFYFFS